MDEINFNGEVYVKKGTEKQEVVNWTGKESLASRMIGKKVIVRSKNEGVNSGIVVLADETGVELKDCRRLWYHKPIKGSWYESIAKFGIHQDSKVSEIIDKKIIIEDYSMTECTDEAFASIMELKPHED